MSTIADLVAYLDSFAPPAIAEEWDNVGLLVGDPGGEVRCVMTCLTITPASAAEAIAQSANLIVAHHPLPFRPLQRITVERTEGRLLWELIRAGVSIYSPHTAFDSAVDGINARLARGLELRDVAPLVPQLAGPGAGRFGDLPKPESLEQFAARAKKLLGIASAQLVGEASQMIARVGIACGSGGEFLQAAADAGCDCLLTGEARFHACLEAESLGVALVLAGHYATERIGIEELAAVLAKQFPKLKVWASRDERDPISFI